MHPRSKHWNLIDYVIVRKRDRQDVRVTKSMCGADCRTDHRLIVSKLDIRIEPTRRPQGKTAPKLLSIAKLKDTNARVLCQHPRRPSSGTHPNGQPECEGRLGDPQRYRNLGALHQKAQGLV